MRSVTRALVLVGLPGAIFAPLIGQVHAVSFCSDSAYEGQLLLLLNELPPCPAQPSTAVIVLLAIAFGAIMVAWSLAPL